MSQETYPPIYTYQNHLQPGARFTSPEGFLYDVKRHLYTSKHHITFQGNIHLADNTKPDVILKHTSLPIPPTRNKNLDIYNTLSKESLILNRLNSIKGIPQVYELIDWFSSQTAFRILTTSFITGQTLEEIIKKDTLSSNTLSEKLTSARSLIQVITACNNRNILHRDLKPANIILSPHLEAHLIDFNNATNSLQIPTSTPQTRLYTPSFCAPEIMLYKPYTCQSEVHSTAQCATALLLSTDFHDRFSQSQKRQTPIPTYAKELQVFAARQLQDHGYPQHIYEALATCLDPQPPRRLASTQELLNKFKTHPNFHKLEQQLEKIKLKITQYTKQDIEDMYEQTFELLGSEGTELLTKLICDLEEHIQGPYSVNFEDFNDLKEKIRKVLDRSTPNQVSPLYTLLVEVIIKLAKHPQQLLLREQANEILFPMSREDNPKWKNINAYNPQHSDIAFKAIQTLYTK